MVIRPLVDIEVFMNQAAKTPIRDLAQHAREHYEEASNAICYWSSVIPKAIDAWELQASANTHLHIAILGMRFDLFIRFGKGK